MTEAKAKASPDIDTMLADLKEKKDEAPVLAFRAEFLEAAAKIEDDTPEWQALLVQLKALKVAITDWKSAVNKRRKAAKPKKPGEEWRAQLILDSEGEYVRGAANVMRLLTHHPDWAGRIGYDEFQQEPTALQRLPIFLDEEPDVRGLRDSDATRIAAWVAETLGYEPGADAVFRGIAAAAEEMRFHPVRDWLASLEWDGSKRLDEWLPKYFAAPNTEYVRAVGSRWLIGAVARVMQPGCKIDEVLVFEGEQGSLKSTGIRTLFGAPWYSDSHIELGDKDRYQGLRGVWCIEVAELDSFKGRDATRIKAYLSSQSDWFRPSYGRKHVLVQRQTVFCGSTNETAYLTDPTGNRRFWPIKCGVVDIAALARDREQLWGEAYARYQSGAKWYLENSELKSLAAAEQRERETEDPWVTKIREWLDRPTMPAVSEHTGRVIRTDMNIKNGFTATDLLIGALGFEISRAGPRETTRVGIILAREFKDEVKRLESARPRRYMYEPAASDNEPAPAASTPAPPQPSAENVVPLRRFKGEV
jgi:hypothetical protein